MKRIYTSLLILAFVFSNLTALAQDDLEIVFRAGPEDAQAYLENYMEPAILSFANGLASGWTNTAKTHKIMGIDLTTSVSLATIPSSARFFSFGDNSDWSNLRWDSGPSDRRIPTLVGPETDAVLGIEAQAQITDPRTGASIRYTDDIGELSAPNGLFDVEDIPFAGVPTPALQLGIGLVKNTDLKIRYLPEIDQDGLSFKMFGIGVMHDIKQWIPGLKLVPIDIAAFAGNTTLTTTVAYNIEEGDVGDDQFYTGDNTFTEFKVSSTTVQVLVSKKLAVFTPYASIGYNLVNANLDMKGTYYYENADGEQLVMNDPVSLDFGGASSARFTIGAQLKLLVLTLHADYTIQKYNTFTAGVGISVR